MPAVPLSDALRSCAAADPDRPAITDGDRVFNRAHVDELVDLAGGRLWEHGIRPADIVAVSATNSAELLMVFFAIWRIGAVPLPLHPRKGDVELADLIGRSGSRVAIGCAAQDAAGWFDATCLGLDELFGPGSAQQVPDAPVSPQLRIGSSGGSTGPAKLISVDVPAIVNPARPWHYGMRADGTHVVPLDLCDGTGFVAATAALALGCHQILMRSFDAETMVGLVEQHRADWIAMTQPSMVATVKLPAEVRERYDVSSLRCVTQYSGGIAEWAKRAWIGWLGPDRIAESYGASDARGSTWITGTEWLERPGSVGRAAPGCEIAIFAADGRAVRTGEAGPVYIRDLTGRRNFHYLQGDPDTLDGGWENFGDTGWLDDEGYLYLVDRTKDLIRSDEGPIAPLPIEGAVEFHPDVRSCVVIGIPGDDGVERVHALVDAPRGVQWDDLERLFADRFAGLRVPDSWELVDGPLRDNAGKATRARLRAARLLPEPVTTSTAGSGS